MKNLIKILFIIFFISQICFAQWPADSTGKINVCTATGDQSYPEIVSDGEGGAIIVWQDERGSYDNVYAQRIDSSGIPRWTANGIIISDVQNSRHPKLVSDGNGGAIITWFDFRNGWPNSSIQAQRINKNGDALWQTNGVTLALTAGSWAYPEIAGYGSDGAIVTWLGVNSEIFAQKIDNSGNLLWPVDSVMLTNSGSLPQIALDDSGGAIVCWFDYEDPGPGTNVFAQRVDSEGNIKWIANGVPICLAPNYQHKPDLVSDGKGGAIISWLDGRYSPDNYVFAQRVDWNGDTSWVANGIQVSNTKGFYRPIISTDGQSGAIITWMGGTTEDIYVQRIDTNGIAVWPNDIRLTDGTNPNLPGIISDGSTGGIVFWVDDFNGKIKVQHIYSDGTLSFQTYGKTISLGANGFINAATDGKGKVICTWIGQSAPNTNIYANRAIVPNFITGLSDEEQSSFPNYFELYQNYPNPFNPSTMISYQLPVSSNVTLKVYDVLGNEIATLVKEEKSAGSYIIEFNRASSIRNPTSGIYFYQLKAGEFIQTKKMILIK